MTPPLRAITLALLTTLLTTACSPNAAHHTPMTTPSPPATTPLSLTERDFRADGVDHRVGDVTLPVGGQIVLTLGSNPSTGFAWNHPAEISDGAVLQQVSQRLVMPDNPLPGTPGTEQWVFQAAQPGTSTVRLYYRRPWETGQQDGWQLTLNIRVELPR